MNFLLRSSISQQQPNPPSPSPSPLPSSFGDEQLVDEDSRGSFTTLASSAVVHTSGGAAEAQQEMSSRLRNRVSVQGHSDVSTNEGALLIPSGELPDEWTSAPDSSHLRDLDRGFVFPGEQVDVLVTISPHDLSVPEIISPFRIAAEISKNCNTTTEAEVISEAEGDESRGLAAREALREGSQKKRSEQLLESFRHSHFYVKLSENDEQELEAPVEKVEPNIHPVVMEEDGFDPVVAGGIARRAIASCSLGNGDIVVMLRVVVAARTSMDEAVLEVLQYEQQKSTELPSTHASKHAQDVLHWLLPLDRLHPFPAPASIVAAPASTSGSTSQRLSFGGSNSTLFSFSHLRSSSQGSLPQVTPSASNWQSPSYPPSALNIAPEEWDRLYPDKEDSSSQETEGLLSFRGVPLEPRRFLSNCGLEGLYVPGKRWRRKVAVVQPLSVESYFADSNTEELICVLVENALPSHMSDVIIYVDSISIICESAGPGSLVQPVPIACVESGEDEQLPNLRLRKGEQHSFILRPTNACKPSKNHTFASRQGKDVPLQTEPGLYAVLLSCRCSHTQSSFYVKHSLKWKPRSPRDLFLSVSLENTTTPLVPNEALPQLTSQVVAVQATNLTSKDMDLTLLMPSAMAASVPTNAGKSKVGNSHSFQGTKGQPTTREAERKSPPSKSHSMPAMRRDKETSVSQVIKPKEKSSASDIVAESSPITRTHLWLQSTVPLGPVPAHSTTVVKCDLLPLMDGIINLDTLHLASKDRSTLYVPESALQIHSDINSR